MKYYIYDINGIINLDIQEVMEGENPPVTDYLEADKVLEPKNGFVYILSPSPDRAIDIYKSSLDVRLVFDCRGMVYYDREGKHVITDLIDLNSRPDITSETPPNDSFNAWDGQQWVFYPWLITEDVVKVPSIVTARQAKLALLDEDVIDSDGEVMDLLTALETTIFYYQNLKDQRVDEQGNPLDDNTIKEIRKLLVEYEAGKDYERNNIFITMMATKFNLTSTDVDNLFIKASQL